MGLLGKARAAQLAAYHARNRRRVEVCGAGTVLGGGIERRSPGGRIEVGAGSFLRCRLVTQFRESRISIGDNCFINARTVIESFSSVSIGRDALIGFGVVIADGQSHSTNWADRVEDLRIWREHGTPNLEVLRTDPVVVEDGVWVGAQAIILPGVTLGEGCTVGAGSVVTKSVPPFTIAAGNPARVVAEVERRRPPAPGASKTAP